MVNEIQTYIHEYDFPYHDYLKSYKEDLINHYFYLKKENKNITDFDLPLFHPITTFLIPKLNKIIKKNYWTDKPIANLGLRAYVQNNKENSSFYHNHKTPGSISGIFYLDPPQEGGEISFLINPDQDIPHLKEIIFKPKKNKLYLFPYWMYHKPLPQKDEDYRICFNWVHGSPTRPIHKFTKSQW